MSRRSRWRGRSCRPKKPYIGIPVGNCPKSREGKIALGMISRFGDISMADAYQIVRRAKEQIAHAWKMSGRGNGLGPHAWTWEEVEKAAIADYHDMKQQKRKAAEQEEQKRREAAAAANRATRWDY